MKLVTYQRSEAISCGVMLEDGIVDIQTAWRGANPPKSVMETLQRGEDCLATIAALAESAKIITPTEQVRLLAPIQRPGKILALAGNYSEHIEEASLKKGFKLGLSDATRKTTVPRPFLKPATTVIGPGDEIPWPAYSEQIDYEIELGVVIGQRAKCVEPKDALECVGGYTIVNDVSARSVTFRNGRTERPWDEFYDWLAGKWADGFCPMGPCLVTRDEIDDVQNLNMELKVNGEIRQKANTSQMIYPVSEVVSFLSHIMTLEAGDVIATGTPAGVAAATGRFLRAGDVVECRIEGLGVLRNTLGLRPKSFYEPLS